MATEKLSIAETADRFGINARQLCNLVAQGLPHEGTGRHRRILWPEARHWRDQQLIAVGKSYGAGNRVTSEAKERRAAAEASLAEIELAERRGELMPLEEGQRLLEESYARVRSKLLAMPQAIAMRVVGETLSARIQQGQALVDEVMADLASGADIPEPDSLRELSG